MRYFFGLLLSRRAAAALALAGGLFWAPPVAQESLAVQILDSRIEDAVSQIRRREGEAARICQYEIKNIDRIKHDLHTNIKSAQERLEQYRRRKMPQEEQQAATTQFKNEAKNAKKRANEAALRRLQDCSFNMREKTESAQYHDPSHSSSKKPFYNKFIASQEYKEDFKYHPELRQAFEGRMSAAHQQLQRFNSQYQSLMAMGDSGMDRLSSTAQTLKARLQHPHFQDSQLAEEYNRALAESWNQKKCQAGGMKSLTSQLDEENEKGLQGVCSQALLEGKVCCANPDKNCGQLSFAKDIGNSFMKQVPNLFSSLGQLQGLKGRSHEACSLAALGGVMAPLSQLQVSGCNKAIEGCQSACDEKLGQFKRDLKQRFQISAEESLEEVFKAAEARSSSSKDPRKDCHAQLREIHTKYKELSLNGRHKLRESSSHKEIISCKKEISQVSPAHAGRGGANPASALAVNICHRRIKPQLQGPMGPSPSRRETAGSRQKLSEYTGGKTARVSLPEEEEDIGGFAEGQEDDWPELPPPAKKTASFGGFKDSSSGDGGSPAAALPGGGAPGGESDKKAGRKFASGRGQKPDSFFTGEKMRGSFEGGGPLMDSEGGHGSSLGAKLAALRKLERRHLNQDDKDFLKMHSVIHKNETLFERASFSLHWFCRQHKCYRFNTEAKPQPPWWVID